MSQKRIQSITIGNSCLEVPSTWTNYDTRIVTGNNVSVHAESGTTFYEVDLSNILPNDGYVYECKLTGELFLQLDIAKGWSGVLAVTSDLQGEHRLCGHSKPNITTSNANITTNYTTDTISSGSCSIEVGAQRKIYILQSQYWQGTVNLLKLCAYRKLYKY